MPVSTKFTLSKTTVGTWLTKGKLLLTRRRFDVRGKKVESEYRVYVSAESVHLILGKVDDIHSTAAAIMDGKTLNPANIYLFHCQAIHLSKFDNRMYYGIHMIDEDGDVVVGTGLNLSLEEFEGLVEAIKIRYPESTDDDDFVVDKRMRVNEQASTSGVVTLGASSSTGGGNQVSEPYALEIRQFGSVWYCNEAIPDVSAVEVWYLDSTTCLSTALLRKPVCGLLDQNYSLKSFSRVIYLKLDVDLLDAVFAHMIRYQVELCRKGEPEYFSPSDEIDELQLYGSQAFDWINVQELFKATMKVLKQHIECIDYTVELELMQIVSKYKKDEEILERMKNNSLNVIYVGLVSSCKGLEDV